VNALPRTLDHSRSSPSSADNAPVLLATQRGLTTVGAEGRIGPGLALSWEVDRAGDAPREVYTFHLDPDVVWSDGVTRFSARDVVFGWRRALLGHEPAELLDLVGAREVLKARERGDDPACSAVRAGFVHLPWLPEQGSPSLPLADMIKALHVIALTALSTPVDLKRVGGTIS
jgi:ABC-type transport system substrate-binding protein